jgi:molybdate transport system permease protein
LFASRFYNFVTSANSVDGGLTRIGDTHGYNRFARASMAASVPLDWFPLWLSLRVAGIATLLVLVSGTFIAYVLSHKTFRGKNFIDSVITLPLVLPPTVLGYYLLVAIGRNSPFGHVYETLFGQPLVFTWQAAVIAAFLHSGPLFIKAATPILEGVNYRYEWAAQSLGASEWRIFWQVTLPLARRGLGSLASLAFARSLGDFGVTIMVAGNIPGRTQTLSVAIYEAVESGNGHLARVLVLIVSLAALALLWPAGYLSRSPRDTL